MKESLNKIIDLINKTGDKCIVLNSQNDQVFVVMDLSSYEDLVLGQGENISRLSEDELLSKINRDVAIWRSGQEEKEEESVLTLDETIKNDVGAEEATETSSENNDSDNSLESLESKEEGKYYFEPVDQP